MKCFASSVKLSKTRSLGTFVATSAAYKRKECKNLFYGKKILKIWVKEYPVLEASGLNTATLSLELFIVHDSPNNQAPFSGIQVHWHCPMSSLIL